MVRIAFVANLALALGALACCAWHAWPDRDRLTFLATATVYGVLLEQLVIIAFEAYRYNVADYILTVGDVPVVIGFGWAAIIYAGYETAHRLSVSRPVLPAFVALFALNIDLAIDAVAIRVPFWQWTPPGAWFGVSLGNFLGWYLVAFLFAGAWLVLSERAAAALGAGWPARLLTAVGTVVLAVAGLTAGLEAWTRFTETTPGKVAVLAVVVVASLVVVLRDEPVPRRLDPRIAAVPLAYHGFYFALLVAFEMYVEQPWLPVVSAMMIVLGLTVHVGALPRFRREPAAADGTG
ncbi:MAG: carotenoid biosynthesis protein [Halobacteriaceae archaeon]